MPTSEMNISDEDVKKAQEFTNRMTGHYSFKENEVGILDLFDDARSLLRDANEFFNKPEVLDFLIKTSVTVLSVTLVFLLFKLVVRGIFL